MVPAFRFTAALGLLVSASSVVLGDLCSDFQARNFVVDMPLSLAYEDEQQNYWSAACSAMRPRCILAPRTAQEVADIVTELHGTTDLFAIKSQGHMPNNGFASIDRGILVSLKNLNQVTYDPGTQTVVAGSGQTWAHLMEPLLEMGRTVVGGRLSDVGLGGYLLGGGLSFLSSQYGWGANNVVNYEIVLANSTIVNANATSKPDLFAALKGGGNNFGIVTAFTLQTHPMEHDVWGGNYVFGGDKTGALLKAVQDFTTNYPDPKAGIILTAVKLAVAELWIMFLFYDGPELPAGVFDSFKAVGPLLDTTKTQSYTEMTRDNNVFIFKGLRYAILTETTPLSTDPVVGVQTLQSYYDHWRDTIQAHVDVPGLIASFAYQPMPRAITQTAKDRGGDLMDFSPEHNYIVLEYNLSWLLAASDARADSAIQAIYGGTRDLVVQHVNSGLLVDTYLPLFMNDAYFRQDYWGRNRHAAFARGVREAVDPDRFFQERTSGGFRVG